MIRHLWLALLLGLILVTSAHAFTFDAYQGINQLSCTGLGSIVPSAYDVGGALAGTYPHSVLTAGHYYFPGTPGTPTASMFYFEKLGTRWWFCTPAGHVFWDIGTVGVDLGKASNAFQTGGGQTKYGSDQTNVTAGYIVSGLSAANLWPFNFYINSVNKLKTFGFNELADGATIALWPWAVSASRWNTGDSTIPAQFKLPANMNNNMTHYAMNPSGPPNGCATATPLKDISQGQGIFFQQNAAFPYNLGDYYDPHFATCVHVIIPAILAANGWTPTTAHHEYATYFDIDEGDQTGGLLGTGYYSTFSPINANAAVPSPGQGTATYHAAWNVLSTDPVQPNGNPINGVILPYSDSEVYDKVALANQMLTEYFCTANGTANTTTACCTGNKAGNCSVDPGATACTSQGTVGNLCYPGSTAVTTATSALNTAWGSNYSTLGTSDSTNCSTSLATCLQNATYAPWGDITQSYTCSGTSCTGSFSSAPSGNPIGRTYPRWFTVDQVINAESAGTSTVVPITGVSSGSWSSSSWTLNFSSSISSHTLFATYRKQLHSTGTGLLDEDGTCPSKITTCWMGDLTTLTGQTGAMQTDLNSFLQNLAGTYFKINAQELHTDAPNLLVMMDMGGYGTPPRLPILQAASQYLDFTGQTTVPPYCPTCTDLQTRIDTTAAGLGDRPWKEWEGWFAEPDSAACANPRTDYISATQGGRATAYTNMTQLIATSHTTAGNYPIVGFFWWAFYDGDNPLNNWGLNTPSDNLYNNHEAASGSVTCSVPGSQYTCGGEGAGCAGTPFGNFTGGVTTANANLLLTLIPGQGGAVGGHRGGIW